jgi:lipopolysaccharide transport system permease protein
LPSIFSADCCTWIAFSEAVQESTAIVVENANLVKRVVFPIEALPVNVSLASVAHQALGTVVLLVAALVLNGGLTVAVFWWLMLLVPQLLITIGLAWLVASLGVF